MTCPYCGAEMLPGVIQSRDTLYWDVEERGMVAIPPLGKRSVCLGGTDHAFSGVTVPTYNCPACKKLVIDYSVRNL